MSAHAVRLPQRRNYQVSGGLASWLAAYVDMRAHPRAEHRFVFADTLYEDADAYRFLLEGVAYLLGRPRHWIPAADTFPDYRVDASVSIADYCGNPQWRRFLADLRLEAARWLPELVWLVDGRDPWEVYRDERFLGNSGADPCSKALKREIINRWRAANCDPARDVFVFGIGEHEAHRFEAVDEHGVATGIRVRFAEAGWVAEAPLVTAIEGLIHPGEFLRKCGICEPRLYGRGYLHNNCGGFCCKAGKAHWQNRLRVDPVRFAYDALMERKMQLFLGSAVAMLEHRVGRVRRPLSLIEFADIAAGEGAPAYDYTAGSSGCGCATEYARGEITAAVAS